MVSEDSLHRVAALAAAVHRLSKSQNGDVARIRQASTLQDRYGVPEAREVLGLGPDEREALEERNDAFADIAEVVDLPIPTAVAGSSHASTAQRVAKELQRSPVLLRHVEGCRELP